MGVIIRAPPAPTSESFWIHWNLLWQRTPVAGRFRHGLWSTLRQARPEPGRREGPVEGL